MYTCLITKYLLFSVALSIVGLYFVICYISTKSENYKQEVNKLVENTIDLLKEQAQNKPNQSYLPIIHIRDHLIPFNERQGNKPFFQQNYTFFLSYYFIF